MILKSVSFNLICFLIQHTETKPEHGSRSGREATTHGTFISYYNVFIPVGMCSLDVLGITDLHNGTILSTLSINSYGFALDFPKRLVPWRCISQCGTPSQQSSPRTKYTIKPPLRPMEPSNNLPLIQARLLWSSRTKYTIDPPLRPMEPSNSLP